MFRRLRNWWYALKCWAWYRHTTVKPRWTGHTWMDRSDLLPMVLFEIVGQYLERESILGQRNDDVDSEHAKADRELRECYRWWTEEYLKRDLWAEFMGKVERPKMSFEPTERAGVTRLLMSWSSEEAEDAYHDASRRMFLAEIEQDDELKARCKRVIDVMDSMWS